MLAILHLLGTSVANRSSDRRCRRTRPPIEAELLAHHVGKDPPHRVRLPATLSVFMVFSVAYLGERLTTNHLIGFALIALGAFFVFKGPIC
jgi:hypothetical protein